MRIQFCTVMLDESVEALRPHFSQEILVRRNLQHSQSSDNLLYFWMALIVMSIGDEHRVIVNCFNCTQLRSQRRALGLRFSKFTHQIFSVCFVNL
ncbi:hypothetical protein FQJ53_10615 [Escherichia coli]|nr:hypothetical protein [Escherichia coli]